jgi:hypothetical protein
MFLQYLVKKKKKKEKRRKKYHYNYAHSSLTAAALGSLLKD